MEGNFKVEESIIISLTIREAEILQAIMEAADEYEEAHNIEVIEGFFMLLSNLLNQRNN